ncbi:hypothetical protein [Kineococcus esterisolvens]|uniref:hypothetical protein n=1 Tax=unclassified Kineococcus TaxID=2621656 RepID=UPI003D7C3ED2
MRSTGCCARGLLGGALLAGTLTTGCAAAEPAPNGPPAVPGDLRVATVDSREEAVGPDGAPRLTWSVDWELRWAAVPGAASYAVRYASAEGVPSGSTGDSTTEETAVRVTAAAGTSSPERYGTERSAGLLFTSSQLLVSVSAVAADGTRGAATGWIPVGDVPADGRPITTVPHTHGTEHEESHGG